jgi:8-oxo-dGTP diphosphatase
MITVTCAIIRNEDDEVLIVQRGAASDHPYKWEFPGGKLVEGETEEECIIREIAEELSMEIVICKKLIPVDHDYGNKHISLIPFICDTLDEIPFLSEHIGYKWVSHEDLLSFDYSEADVFVAKNYLRNVKTGKKAKAKHINTGYEEKKVDTELQALINNMMSTKEADWVATSAIDNPFVFNKLLDYSYSSNKKLAFRASWTLTKVCDRFPEMIYPFLGEIVEKLDTIDNESTLRSFLRILSLTNLELVNPGLHGFLADFCFSILKSADSAIGVKAYTMEILYRLAVIYPELANELAASIHNLMEDGSAGIKSRGMAIRNKLANMPARHKQK